MADSKISALPASTVPLAGTEVLPIVQSSATKQVTVANLTAGRAVATGALTVTGDATLSTGNLVIGTSGNGIDFSATPGTGTSELLADYEEGTWTPALAFGGGTTGITYSTGIFANTGYYTKVGKVVTLVGGLTLTNKGSSTGAVTITGLPFATKSGPPYLGPEASGVISNSGGLTTLSGIFLFADHTASTMSLFTGANAAFTNVEFTNNTTLYGISITYITN